MRFESDKLMIVFPELYMPLPSRPARFDKFDYRAGVGEGLECSMGREGRMGERTKGKLEKILFQRSMGDHTPRSLSARSIRRQTSCVACSIDRAGCFGVGAYSES